MGGFATSGGRYDTTRACVNGRVVTSMSESSPSHTRKFCEERGTKTMGECPKRHFAIPGRYCLSHVNLVAPYDSPSHCASCGDAHPWTMRSIQTFVLAVQGFEEAGPEDAARFQGNMTDIVNYTPMTKPASARLKSIIGKISTQHQGKIKYTLPKMPARRQKVSCSNEAGGVPVCAFGAAFDVPCCIKCTRLRGGAASLGMGRCAPCQLCDAFGPNVAPLVVIGSLYN